MHLSKSFVAFSALSIAAVAAFDPITLTVGTTAFVASGASVGVAAAGLAALAIAKEALIIAAIKTNDNRRRGGRGRREAETAEMEIAAVERKVSFDMEPLFKAIIETDTDDCAKKMVCQAFAVSETERTPLQQKVVALMSGQLEMIHEDPELAVFQLAAMNGMSGRSNKICSTLFKSCPKTHEQLASLVPVPPTSS